MVLHGAPETADGLSGQGCPIATHAATAGRDSVDMDRGTGPAPGSVQIRSELVLGQGPGRAKEES